MVDLNEESINLRALKKIDSSTREIIFCGSQVAVYYYDTLEDSWSRKNIEGTLFFIKRICQPEYAFVVINRLSTLNFVQKITKDFAVNMQSPYLMYKNNENEIYCIWFYDPKQCLALNEQIMTAVNLLKNKNSTTPSSAVSQPINIQLNGLSGSANKQATPVVNNSSNNGAEALLKQMLCLEMNNQNLLSKESTLPASNVPQNQPNLGSILASSPSSVSADLVKPVPQKRSFNLKDLFESSLSIIESKKEESEVKQAGDNCSSSSLTLNESFNDDNKMNKVAPSSSMIPPLNMTMTVNNSVRKNSETGDSGCDSDMKPKNQFDTLMNLSSCLATSMFETPPSNMTSVQPPKNLATKNHVTENQMYLTMEQLKKTLIHLLKNDADFLHVIHTAYVEHIMK